MDQVIALEEVLNSLAHLLVSKFARHRSLYRKAEMYERSGIDLDRSTLADLVGGSSRLRHHWSTHGAVGIHPSRVTDRGINEIANRPQGGVAGPTPQQQGNRGRTRSNSVT